MSQRFPLFFTILSILGGGLFAPGAAASQPDRFVTTVGLTYASLYMTDGFRIGDDSPVLQLSLKLDIPQTNFSLMYWNSLRVKRDDNRFDEHDFLVLYSRDFQKDSANELNFHASYDYWAFPNNRSRQDEFGDTIATGMLQGSKLNIGLSMPKLFQLDGARLVPAYNLYYWLYFADNRSDQFKLGARHEVSLNYTSYFPENRIGFPYAGIFTSLNYHDGVFGVRPGISHTLLSAYAGTWVSGTEYSVALNQQFSHNPTVNDCNEYWISFSVSRVF